jgi:hypothetical protein
MIEQSTSTHGNLSGENDLARSGLAGDSSSANQLTRLHDPVIVLVVLIAAP